MKGMWCGIVTLFPNMISALCEEGIVARAIKAHLLQLSTWDPRQYTQDRYKTVDERPYGGGPGMVMMAAPLRAAINAARQSAPSTAKTIYLSPAGRRFDQAKARQLACERQPLILIAGRYEGIDQRVIERDVDESISIGDYVLSGGELAAMVIIDALTRWLPGALGHQSSAYHDAFTKENGGLLDHPHYTRPAVLDSQEVPAVLLGGDHTKIARWRSKQALGQTWLYRPDILEKVILDEQSQNLLAEFQQEFICKNTLEESS